VTDERRDEFGLVGVTLAGRFHVERVVAGGGFSVVYQATQVNLDRKVAIKIATPPTDSDTKSVERFKRDFLSEARLTAQLQHPHIAQVYDSGAEDLANGRHVLWMALEWIDGVTLRDDLRARRGRAGRPLREAMALFQPVLDAIVYAHARNVIHRDLKPANIMLIAGPRGVIPKVLDFGIGKELSADVRPGSGNTLTARTSPAYTPTYAAPEQIATAQTTRATDVHALGLILTELLVDAPPYGSDVSEVWVRAVSHDRPTPRRFGVEVGAALEAVLTRSLSVAPRDRYPDAHAFSAALEAALPEALERAVTAPEPPRDEPSGGAPLATPRGDDTSAPAHTAESRSAPVVPSPPERTKPTARRVATPALASFALVALVVAAYVLTRTPPPAELPTRADGGARRLDDSGAPRLEDAHEPAHSDAVAPAVMTDATGDAAPDVHRRKPFPPSHTPQDGHHRRVTPSRTETRPDATPSSPSVPAVVTPTAPDAGRRAPVIAPPP